MCICDVSDWLDLHPGRYSMDEVVKGSGLSKHIVVVGLMRLRKRKDDYGFEQVFDKKIGRNKFVYWSKIGA
jgi:hypothetical protein